VVKAAPSVFTPGSVTSTSTGATTALPSLANDTAVVVNGTAELSRRRVADAGIDRQM